MKISKLMYLAVFCILTAAAHAQGPLSTLEAQTTSEVDTDEMTVILSASQEGAQPQALSQSVLATMQRAVAQAKRAEGITTTLGNVSTYPIWGPKGKTTNWTVREYLVLVSKNFASLGTLASELTNELQITNVAFKLSRARRAQEEKKLLSELSDAFREKATAVTQSFGFKSYEVKTLNFTQQFGGGIVRSAPIAMARTSAERATVPIPTEGGRSSVDISVTGTVELLH